LCLRLVILELYLLQETFYAEIKLARQEIRRRIFEDLTFVNQFMI
jgi:hypothetical protein